MKKNILIIIVISILLSGVLIILNKTHAEIAQLSLSVTAGTIDCTAATGIDLGISQAVTSTGTLSGNAWIGPDFGCNDFQGNTGWNYTIVANDLTGTPKGVIAANNITLTPSGGITIYSGFCPSVSTGDGGTLDTAKTLITKANGYGQICSFYLPKTQVEITVIVPAWSPVGSYQSTFTIIYPS